MIFNLTQHPATPEQLAAEVFDPTPEQRAEIVQLLTFDELPSRSEIADRAYQLAMIAYAALHARHASLSAEQQEVESRRGTGRCAMIGGAPYLMAPLQEALADESIMPVYAFSTRESVEETQPDGSVRKTAVFRHKGFVPAL